MIPHIGVGAGSCGEIVFSFLSTFKGGRTKVHSILLAARQHREKKRKSCNAFSMAIANTIVIRDSR